MKKQIIIIIGAIVLLLSTLFSGCINQEQEGIQSNNNEKPLFLITDTGIYNDQSVYVDVQNIDTKTIWCNVIFTFRYIDEDTVGQHPDRGGSTGETGPSGVYKESHVVTKNLEPHKTQRITCPIHDYTGYIFVTWDYSIEAEYI